MKHVKYRILVYGCLLLMPLQVCCQSLKVGKLQCEYKTNPLGVDVSHPHLSWRLSSRKRNILQTAYRVLVSDDKKLLDRDSGNVWDSRKISSGASIQVAYGGSRLKPATTYYWKVEVWDNHDDVAWSAPARWQTGLFSVKDWQGARWIAYNRMADTAKILPGDRYDKKRIRNDTLPLLRKVFEVRKPVRSATAFICGLGQFELYMNGKKIGDHFVDPAWTAYDKEASYVSFDVTGEIKEGGNALGVMLGNGFYYIPEVRKRYRKLMVMYGYPKMICLLKLRYADGTTQDVISGPGWKAAPGPITFSSEYGGEDYNANLEQPRWDTPGFNMGGAHGGKWRAAIVVDGPPALHAQVEDPIKIFEHFKPEHVRRLDQGTWIYDLGQNASGIPRITLQGGKKGDTVRIIPAEVVHKDGSADQRGSGRPSYFTYILKGSRKQTWAPRFSYYGFRYLQVEGAAAKGKGKGGDLPVVEKIEGLHMRNATKRAGTFSCSNKLFDRVNTLIDWAIQSNMVSLFTDCPHREKLGWLEEAHLMGNSMHYDYNIANLYRRTIKNMEAAQTPAGLVPEIAPEYVKFGKPFRDSPEWGSSSVIVPWFLYKWYGDQRALENSYPMMRRYVAYLGTKAQDHILSYGLSDWYDLGPDRPGFSQLTPMGVTATATYYEDLKIMEQVAALLHKRDDVLHYQSLAAEVRKAFNDKFFHPDTREYATGSQTANAMAVYTGLVKPAYRTAVVDNIVKDIRARNNSLTSGDIGYRYLIKALDEAGRSDVIFQMNDRTDVPGYGYQLAHGATALTESWQAYPSASNDHLMLGDLMGWFYEGLGGISQQDSSVAFHRIKIAPEPVGNIRSAEVRFLSPYGPVVSQWKWRTNRFKLLTEIPPNTTAVVGLPAHKGDVIKENGKVISADEGSGDISYTGGKAWIKTGSGSYTFSVKHR